MFELKHIMLCELLMYLLFEIIKRLYINEVIYLYQGLELWYNKCKTYVNTICSILKTEISLKEIQKL